MCVIIYILFIVLEVLISYTSIIWSLNKYGRMISMFQFHFLHKASDNQEPFTFKVLIRKLLITINWEDIFVYLFLILFGVLMVLPFLWMLSTSLKGSQEVLISNPPTFIPQEFVWSNYLKPFMEFPFLRFFFNTFYIAVVVTIVELLFCSLAGYAFARLEFPGRNMLFFIFLGTMMIPIQVRIIPLYKMMQLFGWVDTHLALIFPFLTFFSAWGTFLIRQFAMTIPKELEESAFIDGCNYFQIFCHIILPIIKPALATLGIFTFVHVYNRFLWPLIIIDSTSLKTLPLGLAMFKGRIFMETPWNQLMAISTLSIIPLLILFVIGQKYYIRGVVTSGLKG